MEYCPHAPEGARVRSVKVGGQALDLTKEYRLVTRGYMIRGKGIALFATCQN